MESINKSQSVTHNASELSEASMKYLKKSNNWIQFFAIFGYCFAVVLGIILIKYKGDILFTTLCVVGFFTSLISSTLLLKTQKYFSHAIERNSELSMEDGFKYMSYFWCVTGCLAIVSACILVAMLFYNLNNMLL